MTDLGLVMVEQNILCYLFSQPQDIKRVDGRHFVTVVGSKMFNALESLTREGVEISPRNILIEMTKQGYDLTDPRMEMKVVELFKSAVTHDDFEYLYKTLKEQSIQSQLLNDINPELIKMAANKDQFSISSYMGLIHQIKNLVDEMQGSEPVVLTAREAVLNYEKVLRQRAAGHYFHSTGDAYLDSFLTMGFAPGTQTTAFGTTGSGKTNWALSLFLKQMHKQIPSMYFTMEMTQDILMDRLFASKYGIPLTYLYPHANELKEIPEYVFEELEHFKRSLSKMTNCRIIDESDLSVDDIEDFIREAKKEMQVDYMNVTIDLTTMLREFTVSGGNRADVIEIAMNKLNVIAKKYKVHILNIVQSNRQQDSMRLNSIDDVHKLYPTLNNIKSSNAIAERSRLVLGLFRPKYYAERYFPEAPELELMDDLMHVSILKQSQGAMGEMVYLFEGETSSLYRFAKAPMTPVELKKAESGIPDED